MKLLKTILIVILLLLIFTTLASGSFIDITNNPHKEAIEKMTDLGILEGIGNNLFAPDSELNRAAAAKVAAYLLGYTEEDANTAATWEPMFDDVYKGMGQHEWAIGWINLMAAEKVLLGDGRGNYGPGNPLQMVHWATILTRILEYEEDGMLWPDDYNQMANNLGLTAKLQYKGESVVNRAQMAQMTTTAIYEIEKPGGKKIIDLVEFSAKNEPTSKDDQNDVEKQNGGNGQQAETYENVAISLSINKSLLPAGGGQSIQVTAYVTHNNSPIEGAPVSFFANETKSGGEKREQLSAQETVTDANGKAETTYTSLATDNNKYISIGANTRDDEDPYGWQDSNRIPILASDNASLVEGRVVNPFTGEPYPNANIIFDNMNTDFHILFENASDINGYYSVPVLPGKYYITLFLNLGEKSYYTGNYTGSHHNFRADNNIHLRVNEMLIEQNKNYTLNTEMGIIKGTVTNLGSRRELYLVPKENPSNTTIADVHTNGDFMVSLPEGIYEINASGGHVLKNNIKVEKGKVIDLGVFSR